MEKIVFGIVGGGWRAAFYLRIAQALPERFVVGGMVVRSPEKAAALTARWGVPTFPTPEALVEGCAPSFVVVSVGWDAAPVITRQLAGMGVPVLEETPPAPDLPGLIALNELTGRGAKIQVAEQYHAQPLHAARLAIAGSGRLGAVSQAQISVCHGYHGMSLLRRFMGIGYENAVIDGRKFSAPLLCVLGRDGPIPPRTGDSAQVFAFMDFGGRLGLFDFSNDQYFSPVRALRLTVRGERGEIVDREVRIIGADNEPAQVTLRRVNAGEDGNLEGYFLKGILAGEEWVYKNPFAPGRLTDDEIAIAACLMRMDAYAKGGPDFYSLAEASQDHYLSLMMDQAVKTGEKVRTQTQPWAE